MLKLFIEHKKARGVITIFLTIIYIFTYLMIGVFVDGGRIRMAQTTIEDVQQIATENAMSQYHRGLYEYYGLFGVSDYNTDKIAKDIQAQIEESIGLKIPEDTVKTFMEDVITVGESAYTHSSTLKSDSSGADNVKEYVSQIVADLDDSHKKFDPYGVKIDDVTVSYIDLSNEEMLRAQIRDEMRYTAPLILGANFFSCINQLISLGDATQAVSDVANTIASTSDAIELKRKEYKKSLDDVSTSFKTFVETTYKKTGQWGAIPIDDVIKSFQNITLESVADFLSNIGGLIVTGISNFFNFFGNSKNNTQIESKEKAEDELNKPDMIATDMHYGEEGGYDEILTNGVNNLSRFYDEFDDSDWPYGDEIDEHRWTDEYGTHVEYYYGSKSRQKHRGDITQRADELEGAYKEAIDDLIVKAETTKSAIDTSIEKAQIAMDAIGKAESSFETGARKSKTKKSKSIYLSNMERYLRVWSDIASQKNELLVMKDNVDKLIEILERAKTDVEQVCAAIKREPVDQGFTPSHKLSDKRANDKARFHTLMLELSIRTNVIKTFQNTADSESVQADVFRLLNSVFSENEKEEKEIVDESANALFGNIIGHEKSENILYDPAIADAEKNKEEIEYKNEKLDENNVINKVKEIMNKAGDIITGLPKEIFDNIYDETYILSHCRDYVHTYRYKKNGYQNLSEEEKKSQNIDTVLNTKFIKDQSNTNYLSDAEFNDIQVTPAEIEYIICGIKEHDPIINNVSKMYANIFILRLALNYIAALTSPNSFRQISELAAGATVFAPVVYAAAPLIYALPQSIKETKEIMYDCKKVSIWNGGVDLKLYSAFEEMGKEMAKDAYDKVVEKAKKVASNVGANIGILATIAAVNNHHPPANIESACSFVIENKDLLDLNGTSGSTLATKDKFDDNKVKAGYSDYLLIYLFLGGMGDNNKKTQINRLQDIIQTNMQKVDDKFELRTTYSQIGVETNCSIKYLFMTQALMGRAFSNAKKYEGGRFPIRIRTSFAY